MRLLRTYILILCAALSFVVMPSAAMAEDLYCDGSGGVGGGQLFYADREASAGNCAYYNQGLQHIFSHVVCEFVLILDNVLGKTYCGIQYSMVNTLYIVFTIYIMVLGAQLLMGTAQLNAKEIMIRLFKISAVYAFATESAWGIGFMFNFFLAFMSEASAWVLNTLREGTAQEQWGELAQMFGENPMLTADPSDVSPIFGFIDQLVYNSLVTPIEAQDNRVLGLVMALIFVVPQFAAMVGWWLYTTITTLVRTVMNFLMSLAAMAFLISLSPIFLSFLLFESTKHFFNNWLNYMISYVLQVVLVFAIIVMWILVTVQFANFFNELSALIWPYDEAAITVGTTYDPTNTWAVCPITYDEDPDTGAPTANCPNGFDAIADEEDRASLILPADLIKDGEFIYYISYYLISLILITYAFSVLLGKAHDIARSLSGATPESLVLGGWGHSGFGAGTGQHTPSMLRPRAEGASNNLMDNLRGMVGIR